MKASQGRERPSILKLPGPNVVRWTRRYIARGVDLAYLADLFDVDAEALACALEGP